MVIDESFPIVLFDGVCNLCKGTVQFIIKRDPKKQFKFASIQSEQGQALLKKYNIHESEHLHSMMLVHEGKTYRHSSAGLHIAKMLTGAWPLFYGFMIVPTPIRDRIYNFVGRNRYKWFGKTKECWVPNDDLNDRFL